ncbi:MAG: hypothetical protein ACJAQT_002603 [Akkermansiaceae bacterium]|jgi:hypothetical protein
MVSFMKWICLIALFCVSCGSNPTARPFAAQLVKKKEPAKANAAPEERAEQKQKTDPDRAEPKRKALAGKVTFQNLSQEELAAFRVIPESGTQLIAPENTSYNQVDGFWWRGGNPNEWFKIPDSSAAWIGNGEAPEDFDRIAHHDDLRVHYRSSALLQFVGTMKNGIKHPDWVRDAGQTKSPVPSPWAGEL